MSTYGQFCPVAKAAEILGERWTLLVVRELLLGTTRYSELQRALAKASPTILSKRLKELEQAGVIERRQRPGARYAEYALTPAGRELATVVEAMGGWAARWAIGRLERDELDEYFLMLDVSRRLRREAIPGGGATLGFRFRGGNGEPDWWLVADRAKADICDTDPGYPIDLMISGALRTVTEVWLGHQPLAAARAAGKLRICGQPQLERSLAQWLGFSAYADVARTRR